MKMSFIYMRMETHFHMKDFALNLTLKQRLKATRKWPIAIHCDGHILISFVFPQFTSFHSVFHSSHGLMNSINWPASSVWVFIAQLGEHCSANAEATGSNPVEAPKNFFSGYFRNCLNCDSLRWSHTHFICIPEVHIISLLSMDGSVTWILVGCCVSSSTASFLSP